MSTNTQWHQFIPTAEDDSECASCLVVVSDAALATFTAPCPTPPCPGTANPDDVCVIVPGRSDVCRCIYCGRAGGRAPDDDEPYEPGEDELEPDDADEDPAEE